MRKLLIALVVVIVVVAIAGAWVINDVRRRLQEPYKGYESAEVIVDTLSGFISI